MTEKTKIEQLIWLLKELDADRIPPDGQIEKILLALDDTKVEVVSEALHFSRHFLADEDIRGKDSEYSKAQHSQLKDYVREIHKVLLSQN